MAPGPAAGCTVGQNRGVTTLKERLKADLTAAIDRLQPGFLNLTIEAAFHDRIDAARIAARYPDGGLARRLLTSLSADPEHPDAATLAHELIEEVSRT